jgi:transposase
MTISEETRERVVQAYLSGKGSMPYIADLFGVSLPSVKKWVSMYRKTGTYMTGKVSPGRPRLYTQEMERVILSFCTEQTSLAIVGASQQ